MLIILVDILNICAMLTSMKEYRHGIETMGETTRKSFEITTKNHPPIPQRGRRAQVYIKQTRYVPN